MPRRSNNTQNVIGSEPTRKEKRKANSPLENNGRPVVSKQSSNVSELSTPDTYTRQILFPPSDTSGIYSTPMSFPQAMQSPFSPQQAQAQMQGTPGMYMPYSQGVQFTQTKPDWANEIMDSVKQIQVDLNKLHGIEKTVNLINTKVTQLETKMSSVETRVSEVESSCSFMSSQHDDFQKQLKGAKDEVSSLRKECDTVNALTSQLKKDKQSLETKVTDLEWRSMRENLVFFGIKEQRGETADSMEDCKKLVKEFCEEQLGMSDVRDVEIDRAHRLGKHRDGAVRPIVVKFHRYEMKERIRKLATDHKDRLKHRELGVRDQLPKGIMDRRKELYPIMDREKARGNTVKLVRDRLFINNRLYTPE